MEAGNRHMVLGYTIQGGQKIHAPFFEVHNSYIMTQEDILYIKMFSSITSKSDILNAAVIKYSLHKVRETTLH